MNHDDKTMLALAALTYRGFGNQSEDAIDKALRPWLPKLETEGLGRWELVWGPASFRAHASLFDDAMAYVVCQRDRPAGARPRYALAIRGTNPLSLFDWVFGDLFVAHQVDWAPGIDSSAKLSASSALGLAILQHLAAETPPSTGGRFAELAEKVITAAQKLVASLPEFTPRRLLTEPDAMPDAALLSRIETLSRDDEAAVRPGILIELGNRLTHAQQPEPSRIEQHVFDGLIRQIAGNRDPGQTLMDFLNTAVPPDATVVVTGHSKGGALAPATALWLAENWAPANRTAEIQCHAFAGPTPGNEAFARRYNERLAHQTRRIVNRLDIVPAAWSPEALQKLTEPYPILAPAILRLANSVSSKGYTHVGGKTVEVASTGGGRPLLAEITHQHLDAYLQAAAFVGRDWNAKSLFLDATSAKLSH